MNFNYLLVVAVIIVIYTIAAYNRGVSLRNYVNEAFSTMDVYLKKRWDLIPNLVETVKGYAAHEQNIFLKVTELRSKNYSAMSTEEKIHANKELNAAIGSILAVAENYPNLKANETYTQLMNQLNELETDIANSRKYYNGTVREINTFLEVFPTNIIGNIFGIKKEKMFEIVNNERENIKVEF